MTATAIRVGSTTVERIAIAYPSEPPIKLSLAGATGPANSLAIGTVTTSAPGSAADAEITGTAPSQVLDLTLPRGDVGPPNSLAIGTVTTGAPGSAAAATITGSAPSQTLALIIPRGDVGAPGADGVTPWTLGAGGVISYSANYVGIGTATPAFPLHVQGGAGFFENGLRLGNSYSAIDVETGAGGLYLSGSPGALNHIFVNNSGFVGLGTASPVVNLHVKDTAGAFSDVIARFEGFSGQVTTISGASLISGSSALSLNGGTSLSFQVGSVERARFIATGDLGIATTTPQKRFSVATTGDAVGLSVGEAGSATGKTLDIGYYVTADYGRIQAVHAGTGFKPLVLNPGGGNVGVGTTSPTAALDSAGDTYRQRTARTPASATAAGNAGDICWDTNYVYVCVATNTWKRSALATW